MHPLTFFFLFFLFFTVFLLFSVQSWFIAWVLLEINLVVFLPLIFSNNNNLSSEATINYFLIQAFTSVLIIYALTSISLLNELSNEIILFALIINIAVAPCHQWLPSLVEALNWNNIFLLLTLQNLAPLVLLLNLINETNFNSSLILFIVFSASVGSVGGLTQQNLTNIITYSSISNIAWVLTAVNLNNYTWVFYFLTYSIILLSAVLNFWANQITNISHLFSNTSSNNITLAIIASIISLAGLPPFSGFVPNLLVTQQMFFQAFTLILILLSATFLNLFFYIRIFLPNILNSTLNQNTNLNSPYLNDNTLFIFNLSVLFLLPSCFLLF